MSRIGVIGLVGPDYFADNVGDALQRLGHVVTQLGAAHPRGHSRLATRTSGLARQALPRLDERAQDRIVRAALDVDCEIIISLDLRLMPSVVARFRSCGLPIAFWFPDHIANLGRQLMLLAPYNAIFFKEPFLTDYLRAMLDLPFYYLPGGLQSPLAPADHQDRHRALHRNRRQYVPEPGTAARPTDREGNPAQVVQQRIPRWIGETPSRAAHTGRYIAREEKARVFRSAEPACLTP